ncbi:putative transposase [Paraburkholderia unamae]|uniref:Transposase n=2 Tax=Paraburkholderia unamae TaxID=219649 RepID=A0ABX5KKK0_9BURK|nr:putative transposase [Paraburkholderia unamae]
MAAIRTQAAQHLIGAGSITATDRPSAKPSQRELLETDAQRLTADARKGILTTLDRLTAQCHISREAAMITLLTEAKAGKLDDHMVMMLKAARDERGRKGDGFPSVRTLKRWLAMGKAGDLAPKKVQPDFTIPAWAKPFLGFYQLPQKPSVELAYREFEKAYRMRDNGWSFPTIHQVRRFLGKLGNVSREVGRMGPRELKNIRPFVRRTFDQLQPNDVWSADGHTFDAEVQHPLHGRPFRPEITTIIDIATRMAVGFSVGLAESSLAVLEAISHAAINRGAPAIFYVDNGSGYDNQLLKREGTGLKGLLGFEVTHSLPYNSQAKGVIERSHQTIWIQGAKLLPSFIGASMDREARLAQYKITRAAVRKGGVMPLMGWESFVQFCTQRVDEYNDKPHRSLAQINDPVTGKRRHMSPREAYESHRASGWEPVMLTAAETQNVFRPRVERTVSRGEIALFNNRYFSGLLEEFHGEQVQVAFDIHDAQHVWVHDIDGRFICTAEFGANQRHYMPMSFVEQAREKRADARLKRLDAHRDEIEAERHGAPALTIETPDTLTIPGFGEVSRAALDARVIDVQAVEVTPELQPVLAMPVATVIEMPEDEEQRVRRWHAIDQLINEGGTPTEKDMKFHELYGESKEFTARKRREQEAGEWQLAGQR